MRTAVIADVHGNLPALEAVLADIDRQACDRIICLGDLVGYNAQPAECVQLVAARVDVCVAGNHDRDLLRDQASAGTRPEARLVQRWSLGQLSSAEVAYLADLPNMAIEASGLIAAHGCYLNDSFYRGYVTSTMLEENLVRIAENPDWPKVALCGHTHTPLSSWLSKGAVTEVSPDGPLHWPAEADAVLLNPGSVGQPRDGDSRASYMVIDPDQRSIGLRRLTYDVERAVRAIVDAALPERLAQRLREGR